MDVLDNYIISKIEDIQIELDSLENSTYNQIVKEFADSQKGKGQSIANYEDNRKAKRAYENNLIGKKGEFFAKIALLQLGFPDISIDVEIREGKSKGWRPDLPYAMDYASIPGIPNVHVRTCDDFTVGYAGKSWTFQLKNASGFGGTDPILERGEETDLVVFVYISNWESNTATIHAIIPWGAVKKYPLLQLPVSVALKEIKRCIYLTDLVTYKKYIEKWKP